MKKKIIIIALITAVLLCLVLPKSNIEKSDVYITKDYSTIYYYGEVYVPIQHELLPENLDFPYYDGIDADVEGANFFLDKFFFTNYIYHTERNGEKFIDLHTDYDRNESDYYCLPSYKEKVMNN